MIKLDINQVNLIALYTGNKGYSVCPCKCPCCSQKDVEGTYQGNLQQIKVILDNFKNLEQLYFFGNPDPVVDADFCNKASKLAIENGVNVSYSTSGIGGVKKLKELLKGIDSKNVDYISFSIDSVNPEKLSMLKGIKYPFDYAVDGIKWAIDSGYITKIQPTLWSSNYMDTASIIEYFALLGVKKFSFHVGSVETNSLLTHQHLTPEQIKNVHSQIDDITKKYDVAVTCPVIYPSCGDNNEHKWYCMNPKECYNWLVFLRENGVFATHVPIMSEFDEKYCFDITKPIYVEEYNRQDFCPLSDYTAKTKTLCRYISKTWNNY